MRQLYIAAVLVLGGLGATSTRADAAMRCTPYSCIDSQTGYYTQSTCSFYGCRPLGGVVGRVGPGGYDSKYDPYAYDRPYVRHRWGHYRN
jgi:hypothetical protein